MCVQDVADLELQLRERDGHLSAALEQPASFCVYACVCRRLCACACVQDVADLELRLRERDGHSSAALEQPASVCVCACIC